eukprot:11230034-Ditylum_brightwellii.AAC.1
MEEEGLYDSPPPSIPYKENYPIIFSNHSPHTDVQGPIDAPISRTRRKFTIIDAPNKVPSSDA